MHVPVAPSDNVGCNYNHWKSVIICYLLYNDLQEIQNM